MKTLLPVVLLVALNSPALAQHPTMAVSADAGSQLVQWYDTPTSTSFDLVVWVDTLGEQAKAAEFVMTDLTQAVPGVLKVGTTKINAATLDVGDNSVGEYVFLFGDLNAWLCAAPSPQLEIVRVEYLDSSGLIGRDVLVNLRGLQTGDSVPGSFQGEPGFIDCQDVKHPCRVGGADGGYTNTGLLVPDGTTVLNPTVGFVAGEVSSMGLQKARF